MLSKEKVPVTEKVPDTFFYFFYAKDVLTKVRLNFIGRSCH